MGQLLAIRYALMICITNGGAWFMMLPLNWTFSAFECPFLGAKPSPEHGWATLIFIRSTHSSAMFGFMVGACPWIFFSDMPSVLVAKLALLPKKIDTVCRVFLVLLMAKALLWNSGYLLGSLPGWSDLGWTNWGYWSSRFFTIWGSSKPLDESTRVNLGVDTSYISAVSYNVMNHRYTIWLFNSSPWKITIL